MAAPIRFLSGRQQQQKIGVIGSTENEKVLEVVGRVGIGTTIFDPTKEIHVQGDGIISGNLHVGSINITGISTLGIATFTDVTAQQLNVSGITTLGVTILTDVTAQQLNVSGVSTFQGNVNLGDDDKLIFGDDQDLEIFHNSSNNNTIIQENNNGNLVIKGTNLFLQSSSGEDFFKGDADGAVTLYYDDSKKFETTGVGVSIVNGTSDTATIYGPSNLIIDPMPVGVGTTSGVVRIKGDLYVDGTTTQINSTVIELADFIVGIATTATTDVLADGAGIQIGPDNTFLYEYNGGTNPSLKSSENLNIASGKHYQIGENEVLSASELSSNISVSLASLDIDGGTDIGENLADGDLFIVDDGANGTNRKADILGITTYTFSKVSGDITISATGVATIQSDGIALGDDTTGNYVEDVTAGAGLTKTSSASEGQTVDLDVGAGTGITVNADDVAIKNADNLTGNKVVKWDDGNGQLTNSVITDDGTNVGIGTTNPLQVLQVGTANTLGISTDGKVVVVTSDGDVGIGTTNPTQKLDVAGSVRIREALYDYNNSVGDSTNILGSVGTGITWKTLADFGGITGINISDDTTSTTAHYLAFTDQTSGQIVSQEVSSTKLVYKPEGKLGIGTTNPTSTLTVDGTVNVSDASTFTSTVEIKPDSDIRALIIDQSNATTDTNPHITLKSAGPQVIDFRDAGDGNGLKIAYRTSSNQLRVENSEATTTHFLVDRDDGRVELNYGGSKKFETTSTGVSITGDIIVSTGGTIGASSGIVTYYGDGTNLDLTDSVALGGDTTGDYVQSISGTSNQITVTGGTGEGSTPTLSIPNQFTIPQDATVTRDLQVNRDLNVDGNITVGGTSGTLFTEVLKVSDADLILGVRTDANGNDISTDNTANHGGIAIASTEGNPLITLINPGAGETLPSTYKKIMWFKAGSFSGLGTDAWLSNYAVGIGSTQFPTGTRLAAGSVQFTENDISVVRDINASGIGTFTTLDATNATIDNLTFTSGTAITSVDTDLTVVSGSDDTLASAKAIKTYVDDQVTAQDLDFAGDSGTGAVDLDSESLTISGTTNEIETSASNQTLTIGLPNEVAITTSLTVGDPGNISGGVPTDEGVLAVYTSGGKNALIIQTSDNNQSRGIAFRNKADSYIGYISIEQNTGNLGDMVFGVSDATNTDVNDVEERLRITKDGNVGIGTTNPTVKLDVVGTVKATDFDSLSDQNLKTNIQTMEDPLAKILQIRGVNFEWKENNKPSAGVIAQEVEKILPQLVKDNGTKSVNYNGLIGLLIEAVKAQQEEIDILKSKIK